MYLLRRVGSVRSLMQRVSLVVDGVPKNGSSKDAEKWLRKWGVEEGLVVKVRKAHKRPTMTVHVPDEAAAQAVTALLQGRDSGKGKTMEVRTKDVGGMTEAALESLQKKQKKAEEEGGVQVVHEVRDVVTPQWKMPYAEQVAAKNLALADVLKRMWSKNRREANGKLEKWPITQVTPMEVVEGGEYRNKLSFTIGYASNGGICIGFRVGRTEHGSTAVADPNSVSFCSPASLAVRNALQNLLEKPGALPARNNVTHLGFWRQLEVRTNLQGESLAVVQVDETGIEPALLAQTRAQFKEHMMMVPGIIGLGWQHNASHSNGSSAECGPVEFLVGDGVLVERIRDISFRIPPSAFFQTNSVRVVALYDLALRLVKEEAARLAAPGRVIKVYDVCCGIGTIGLYLRRYLGDAVGEVVGIDIEPSAIEAAQENAKLNALGNVSFIASAAEKVLPSRLKETKKETLIAVVDPPRAGLHPDVLRALRNCESVESIVYISCNTKSLVQDCLALCKPPTKRYEHQPFDPVFMTAVDMFPNTDHLEAAVVFQRRSAPPAAEAAAAPTDDAPQ